MGMSWEDLFKTTAGFSELRSLQKQTKGKPGKLLSTGKSLAVFLQNKTANSQVHWVHWVHFDRSGDPPALRERLINFGIFEDSGAFSKTLKLASAESTDVRSFWHFFCETDG